MRASALLLLLFVVLLAACAGARRTDHVLDPEGLSENARELWLEARAAAWDGRRDQAIDALEGVARAHPAHVPTRLWLTDLRAERDGDEAERERLADAAESGGWIDALLFARLEPEAETRLVRYEALLAANPSEVWLALAVADAALDAYGEASAEAQRRRDDGTIEGQERAQAADLEAARALRRAETVATDAVRRRPRLVPARWRQAEVLAILAARETGRERALELRREVIEAYDSALAVDPDDVPSLVGRADAHRRGNAHGAARDDLRRAARVNPGSAVIRQDLAVIAYEMGDFALAEREFRAAVERRPRDADLRRNLGDALAALGRFADAGREYAAALRIRPDDASVIERLGNLALRLDDPKEAMRHYERYLEIGGPNPERVRAAIRRAGEARRAAARRRTGG